MDGLHILASLYRCRGDARLLTDAAALRESCIAAIGRAGLTALGDLFRQFPGPDGAADPRAGVTGCVVLAESHLAVHTWPEIACVTLDAYVCNYSCDNTGRARALVDDLTRLFQPEECARQDVSRGRPHAPEPPSRCAPHGRPAV